MLAPTWAKLLAAGTLLAPGTEHERLQTVLLAPGKITLRYRLGIVDLNGFPGHNAAVLGCGIAALYLPIGETFGLVAGFTQALVVSNKPGRPSLGLDDHRAASPAFRCG